MRQLRPAIALVGLVVLLAACEAQNGSLQEAEVADVPAPQRSPVPQKELNQKNAESQTATADEETASEPTSSETYESSTDNPFESARNSPLSTFSIDVDTASYSNVRRFLNGGQRPPQDAVRLEELINYFSYEYPQPQGGRPFSINTEIAAAPWNPKHRLVQIGLQGKKIAPEKLPPSNLVFLIDVSGSMSDRNKLPLLKSAFRMLVNELNAEDKVSIVVYAGAAGVVLPPTPGSEKETILQAIENLEAGGSTAGGEGIQRAYKLAQENFLPQGNNRVILASDGDFNVGISSDTELVKLIEGEREKGVFLTVLGFGSDNFQDAKMEKLANKGNGNYAYIDNELEANKVLVTEMGGTLLTIAKDVKIQVQFNPEKVQAYRLIGYENRRLQDQDFEDDTKDAGELGAGHTVTALYEVIPVGIPLDVELLADPSSTDSNPETPIEDNALVQVNLRYKDPKGSDSKLLSSPVADAGANLENASENFKFAAAVASFGMVLRDSPYKGNASLEQALSLAQASEGVDLDGYRAEFIRLIQSSKKLVE
ncbi:VWA domain-containing protein [Lusitaniella coriacea LEGE 07157]|uniref:VWA domain-containing protein n=1 Tax=Lusitaniella coriacea LEGE 07157 TaxID=945747 RepID=A0A8J7DXT2_9CYAN|nr:VWA domain-containing protein [Lusitaniella coriacea]MBE9117427.1 VWA domain-containing protein [Lusitaniella coriacea LEGE 07157]